MREYFVYIMSNAARVLYTGVTSQLINRVHQHRQGLADGFTKRHHITWLVYYETTSDVWAALLREKQIKGWRRDRKMALIRSMNPDFRDLSEDWVESQVGTCSTPDPSPR